MKGLTLAGQTASGGGITVRDHGIQFNKCSDVIVRFMRFRLGDKTKTSEDVIGFGSENDGCTDVILDHVTATWGIDGIMDVYAADRFTMQWCLFGEALNDSTHHKKQPHAMLMSFRKIKGNISIHHNLPSAVATAILRSEAIHRRRVMQTPSSISATMSSTTGKAPATLPPAVSTSWQTTGDRDPTPTSSGTSFPSHRKPRRRT